MVYAERAFDWRHGTDTAGIVDLHELGIDSANKGDGGRYEGANPVVFHLMMQQIPIHDFCERTFLDFGCGKGLAMMLASQYGFRKIIGVEFSRNLCDICLRNLKKYQRSTCTVNNFEIVHADAAEYQIPPEATVFFFFNPFGSSVLARVLHNIETSLAQAPRQIWIAYENALHHDIFVARGFRVILRQTQNSLRIYPGGSSIYTNAISNSIQD
ncbi:MAG: class I SAM-dependent methyltransferase [candidate division NC10 bacterium]|nr:class I SAM-dependent methyltransferase [candidate division NC10 bacterium]MDE2321494.1 class I SAM-dependent methyltransferase [candidate division NC10 bacterium]